MYVNWSIFAKVNAKKNKSGRFFGDMVYNLKQQTLVKILTSERMHNLPSHLTSVATLPSTPVKILASEHMHNLPSHLSSVATLPSTHL